MAPRPSKYLMARWAPPWRSLSPSRCGWDMALGPTKRRPSSATLTRQVPLLHSRRCQISALSVWLHDRIWYNEAPRCNWHWCCTDCQTQGDSLLCYFLMAAQCLLTSPALSLVMHIACVEKPPDLIDCKVCGVGSARQLISFCLTAYIRRITSERLRNRQEDPWSQHH